MSKQKALKRFMYKLPGTVYANGPVVATSERKARELIRRSLGVDRVPRFTTIWETSQ